MIKYRKERLNNVNNFKTQSNEEKIKSSNNQTSSNNNSNPPSFREYMSRRNKRIKKDENATKITNVNNNKNTTELSKKSSIKNDNINKPQKNVYKTRESKKDNSDKENVNPNKNKRKSEILEKLKLVIPILEDKEGEENISPNRQRESNYTDRERDNKSLCNNMFKNDFKKEEDYFNDNAIKSARNSNDFSDNYKNKYNNVLIDAILNVEKYNVGKYLSKDLASIYDDITKDNIMFKNDIFLGNVDNFERKTGDLDKKKLKNVYKEKESKKKEYKEITNTNDIINKFFEKTKTFH